MEAQGRRMRSSFFSSVAHELRTPLNSVIPILKMVLDMFSITLDVPKTKSYISIALNSSIHLQNVIEDALDITRMENNKF
jgi:signal transduction histidine kinase